MEEKVEIHIRFSSSVTHLYLTGDYEDLDAENMTMTGNYTGRYRSYRGVSVPTPCPAGSYCPIGTMDAMEYLCPPGSYNNQTSLQNETQCTPCDPGMYCSGEGETIGSLDTAFHIPGTDDSLGWDTATIYLKIIFSSSSLLGYFKSGHS